MSTSHSRDRCFNVSLTYRVRPTVTHNSFKVTYDWDRSFFEVSGLSSSRTLFPLADGTYQASEELEVCGPNHASPNVLFQLEIEALADHDRTKPREWFKRRASVAYIFGSERWQTDLSDEIASLKAQIDGGDTSPYVLRRYWRLIGTMYHGGAGDYAAYLQQRVRNEVPASSTSAQSMAYYALLLRNGENIAVTFSPFTGQVVSIQLNESYQLKRSYRADLLAMLKRGLISRLMRVDSMDSFKLVSEKEVGTMTVLRYKRVRRGVTLLPDKLIVFIEPSGAKYTVRSIVADLGDVGGATCGRVNKRLIDRHDPANDPSMTVIWSGKFLYRHEGTYRCVYLWQSEKQLPVPGDMKASHVRIVDIRTGEVLLDADGIKPDGGNDDTHYFDTYLTVPYKTPSVAEPDAWYDIPTRLPALRVWAMGPESDPVLYHEYYNPLLDGLDGFVPSVVIDDLDPSDDHTDYRYLQIFEHKPEGGGVQPTIHNFLSREPFSLYAAYLVHIKGQGYDGFLPDNTADDPNDFLIPYRFEFDDPDEIINTLVRAAAVTAQAYSLVQYSRYIWGLTNWGEHNWSPWTDGPSLHCSGDEVVHFKVRHPSHSPCPSSALACQDADWIVMHSDAIDNKDEVMTLLAHEYGHWVSNVHPMGKSDNKPNHTQFAKAEAYALHSVSSLWANWLVDWHIRGQFQSSDPDRLFAGNRAYSSLLFDHHTGDMYHNARIFAGMYNQYMNTVGSYHTDPVIGWSYFESADWHHPGLFCGLNAHDYGGDNLGDYAADAAQLYILMLNKDYADRLVPVNPPHTIYVGPNFVKANTIEITRAAKQHDWLQLPGMEYPSRVSVNPSHAHAITVSSNQATVLNVKYTPIAREKWVNFFASANVKYNIYTFGGAGQEIELYRVLERTQGGYLQLLGENAQCTEDTVINDTLDNVAVVDVEKTHDTCITIAGIAQPSITFTPKKRLYPNLSPL